MELIFEKLDARRVRPRQTPHTPLALFRSKECIYLFTGLSILKWGLEFPPIWSWAND